MTETWDQACAQSLAAIVGAGMVVRHVLPYPSELDDIDRMADALAHGIDQTKSAVNSDDWNEGELVESLLTMGVIATHQVFRVNTSADVVAVLCDKQAAYGPNNILAFGLAGIHVRMSDKVARIKNLLSRDEDPSWESLNDSFLDLVGYAVVTHMLHNGTFTLPLERDL